MSSSHKRPLLFCNIAWMKHYEGGCDDDTPVGGGRFVNEHGTGHEVFNFKPYGGKMYGFVRVAGGGQIKIERLGASKSAESIAGVDVVWTARKPGESKVVVGWYRNATVYRTTQRGLDSNRETAQGERVSFCVVAKASNCTLLSARPDHRLLPVPNARRDGAGSGQSNVWYGGASADSKFRRELERLFKTRGPVLQRATAGHSTNHRRVQLDTELRKRIELDAVRIVAEHYESFGYRVKDVSKQCCGWDLTAENANQKWLLEVKGCSGDEVAVELTPNEYATMLKKHATYRICVVTGLRAAGRPHGLRILRYSKSKNKKDHGIMEGDTPMRLKEQTAAVIRE